MSKQTKAIARILSLPNDYTYSEAKWLLNQFGFQEFNKGKTSGSRVKFYRQSDKRIILLHKPHPGNQMKPGAVKSLVEHLKKLGEL